MVNLMNMTKEECAELIEVLEREQSRLQSGVGRSSEWPRGPSCDSRQETIKRLLWKARTGSLTPDILDPSELIEYRLGGYC
jgi:hypothetical protein